MTRLPDQPGERIDRSRELAFTFDGRKIHAYVGDTIASAVIASGQRTFSRSFKYHRPRGEFCGCGQCANSLVDVDGRPSVRACSEPVVDGMRVSHQNAWPSLKFDLMRVTDKFGGPFTPVGFYYKTFIRPRRLWPLYEKVLRRAAGLGRLPERQDEREWRTEYRRRHCDVLVVGGGPAGAAAAIYAARKGIRTAIVAERFGGQVLDTMAIENFVSVSQTEGPKFVAALEQHVRGYDVEILNAQRAAELVPAVEPGGLAEVRLANGARLKARSVILSTGARWRNVGVPGEQQYRNRGVAYCPHCDGPLFKGKRVAVIGGGNSGVEAAIDLAGIVSHVTLVEYDPQLRADAVLTRKLHSLANVTVITNAQTTEVVGDGQRVTALHYKERQSGALRTVDLAGVFVQIGLVPNTDWLKGVVKLSPRGEVEVDARGQTSVPGVFAAGDCTVVPYKQIVIAVGEGAKASLSAFDHLIRSPLSAAA